MAAQHGSPASGAAIFKLPVEIRLDIWRYVLAIDGRIDLYKANSNQGEAPIGRRRIINNNGITVGYEPIQTSGLRLALLCVSQKIHGEALTALPEMRIRVKDFVCAIWVLSWMTPEQTRQHKVKSMEWYSRLYLEDVDSVHIFQRTLKSVMEDGSWNRDVLRSAIPWMIVRLRFDVDIKNTEAGPKHAITIKMLIEGTDGVRSRVRENGRF